VHLKEIISLCGAIVAAIALVSVSGASAAKSHKIAGIDVSSRASIVHYLRSIHVNPKGVVIQRGRRNYAGPRCPGPGWRCARTLHAVVQIAGPGAINRFRCTTTRCAVVQIAAAAAKPNKAVCIRQTGLTQSCTINQSGAGPNMATVYENAATGSGLTQTASSKASITQLATGTSASNSNTACVTQNVVIDGSTTAPRGTPVTVTLEAHQSVTIKQDVLGNGANSAQYGADSSGNCLTSPLAQNQTLTSTANGSGQITQNENDALIACGDGVSGDYANMCLDIEQNQGSGKGVASGTNNATFTQTNSLTAIANTSGASVSQTQSSICPTPAGGCLMPGGLVGTVNQDSSVQSTASVTQTETQCEDAARSGLTSCDTNDADASEAPASLTQTQHGPEGLAKFPHTRRGRHFYKTLKGLGTARQTGNTNGDDTFTITQTSTQDDDQGTGSTQTNVVQGDCQTSGTCTDTQTTQVNGQTTINTQSGENVNAQTSCSGSDCTVSGTDLNILIAGTGDFSDPTPTEPNDNLTQALTAAGYSVTETATLPADLSSFGQVWWVDATPMTTAEQNQLINFEETGRGVYLTGERPCCEDLNAADQTIVNSVVSGGGITVGGQGDVCTCNSPLPVNPTVVGNLATQPHTVTSWQPNAPGGMAGVPASSVFSYYQPDEFTTQVVAAAWDRPSTVGQGRVVVFMDINWPEVASRAANWSDVAENVAFFLSGRSSPPSPPLLGAPIMGPSLLGPPAETTPARATSPAGSGRTSSTR
jgi:hypothetical protein